MRWPRIRFTLRSMMAFVAIAAVPMGLWARSDGFRRTAIRYERERWTMMTPLDGYLLVPVRQGETATMTAERERAAYPVLAYDRYLMERANTYYLASLRPWLPVSPDPMPPPKPDWEYVSNLLVRYCYLPDDPPPTKLKPEPDADLMKGIIDRQDEASELSL